MAFTVSTGILYANSISFIFFSGIKPKDLEISMKQRTVGRYFAFLPLLIQMIWGFFWMFIHFGGIHRGGIHLDFFAKENFLLSYRHKSTAKVETFHLEWLWKSLEFCAHQWTLWYKCFWILLSTLFYLCQVYI